MNRWHFNKRQVLAGLRFCILMDRSLLFSSLVAPDVFASGGERGGGMKAKNWMDFAWAMSQRRCSIGVPLLADGQKDQRVLCRQERGHQDNP